MALAPPEVRPGRALAAAAWCVRDRDAVGCSRRALRAAWRGCGAEARWGGARGSPRCWRRTRLRGQRWIDRQRVRSRRMAGTRDPGGRARPACPGAAARGTVGGGARPSTAIALVRASGAPSRHSCNLSAAWARDRAEARAYSRASRSPRSGPGVRRALIDATVVAVRVLRAGRSPPVSNASFAAMAHEVENITGTRDTSPATTPRIYGHRAHVWFNG